MRGLRVGIVAALLAWPAAAGAETYCVGQPKNCQGTATALQVALTSAASSPENDTIAIGEGTFNGPFTYLPTLPDAGTLQVHGSGAGRTVLQAAAANATVLNLLAYDGIRTSRPDTVVLGSIPS